jgi:hypothetical protein
LDIKDAYYWNSSTTLSTMGANFTGFDGGVFDGRYVYLCPRTSNVCVQYDTLEPSLNSVNGMKTFPIKEVLPSSQTYPEYASSVYDGRYIYYIPYAGPTGTSTNSKIVRYDTTYDFQQIYAYSNIDTQTINVPYASACKGFKGGIFDGKYIYYLPSKPNGNVLLQYNVSESFFNTKANVAYQTLSLTKYSSNLYGFDGGIWNLRSIWLPPSANANMVIVPTMAGSLTDAYRPSYDIYQASTIANISYNEILRMTDPTLGSAPTSNVCFEILLTSVSTDMTANYISQKVGYIVSPGNLVGNEVLQPITTIGTYRTNSAFTPRLDVYRKGASYQIGIDGTGYSQLIQSTYQVSIQPLNM